MLDTPTSIVLDVAVTLDDQIRFTEWLLDRPALRWKRVAIRAATIVLVPLLGLVVGLCAASAQDGTRLGPALIDAFSDWGMLQIMATVAAMLTVLYALLRALRRPLLRRRLRRLLLERPGVDPTDPELTERAHLTLGPDGFISQTQAATVTSGWASVKSLADEGRLLVLRTGGWSGYIIPKRCLSTQDWRM
jgi:hypothetical protein